MTRRSPSMRTAVAGLALAAVAALPGPADAQATRVLVVAGLGGSETYREDFTRWAVGLHSALTGHHGLPGDHVHLLGERPDAHPAFRGRSTRAEVLAALAGMARDAGPDDRIVVVLIGHGTSQGRDVQLNLPGPDLSPEDFAAGLDAFPTQPLALVHTGSAGGGFVAPLAGPNRVIVSATASALERNATEFPEFFVQALTDGAADLDKDGRTSLLEAFEFASGETARHYTEENELLTEHAVLEDDGDGEATRNPVADGSDDGALAATFHFGMGAAASATTAVPETDDPELARLYGERADIQQRLDALRAQRAELGEGPYEERLEELLIELALKNREIRQRSGGPGS